MTYDMLGRRIAIQHADAGRHLIVHDASNNIVLNIDGAGQTIARAFDEVNHVLHGYLRRRRR